MNDFVFHFTEVSLRTKHTLVFKGSCTHSNGRTVIIEYNGPEAKSLTVSVPEEFREQLEEKLNDDFGYGPFKEADVKKVFGTSKSYYFKYR